MPQSIGDGYSEAKLLTEVDEWLTNVAANLPESISAVALGVRDKAPYKALAVREALIWRTEELARCSLQSLKVDDLAAAVLLVRSVLECTALMARLAQICFERTGYAPGELDAMLTKMWMGWKSQKDDALPVAFNILTMIDHLDKRIGGGVFRRSYDLMSEFAHPNWSGVAGLYSRNDVPNFATHFGKFTDRRESTRAQAVLALSASVAVFNLDYNNMADYMAAWLAELEKL